MNTFENKVTLITGSSGRLGSSFAKEIIYRGGKLVLNDITKLDDDEILKSIDKGNAIFFEGDLKYPDTITKLLKSAEAEFGKIDNAVHCAYPKSSKWGTTFENLEPQSLERDLFYQLGIPILFSQKIIKFFKKQGFGNLVHISSIQGIATTKFEHYRDTDMVSPIEYTAIKSGLISITKYLSKYCKNQNIRVNCISPGGIISGQPDVFVKRYRSECVSKGMLDPEDVNGALIFLLYDDSKYINGQNIVVDDGWSL